MMGYGNFWNSNGWSIFPGLLGATFSILLIPLLFWSLFWKGWALWKAAKDNSKVWFAVLLVVNTIGILDILYIFLFSKKPAQLSKNKSVTKKK